MLSFSQLRLEVAMSHRNGNSDALAGRTQQVDCHRHVTALFFPTFVVACLPRSYQAVATHARVDVAFVTNQHKPCARSSGIFAPWLCILSILASPRQRVASPYRTSSFRLKRLLRKIY